MKELDKKQYETLVKPLDAEAITQHPTKTYLSSIKAIYVTERLNDVFGVGAWQTRVQEISHNAESGMVVVKVTLEVPDYGIYYESFGGNDNGGSNNKNFDLGDAYKGATTDAITKIGSYLGIGIDVFKGKSNPSTKTNSNKPEKEWLNETDKEKWTKAEQWVRAGNHPKKLRDKYAVNTQAFAHFMSIYEENK